MSRERLPNRRAALTDSVRWPIPDGRKIHVTAGFTVDSRLLETFLRGGGVVGSQTDFLLDDIAVLVSRLLQHSDTLPQVKAGLGRTPEGVPSSIIGAVVDKLLELEGHNL